MFAVSTDINPLLLDDPNLLPKRKQKLVDLDLFDPEDAFFRTGAHMALLGFLGSVPTRSDAALLARETKNREKLKEKRKAWYNKPKKATEDENEGAPTRPVSQATSSASPAATLHSV